MNADKFNLEIRKFLKEVGITSQKAIEKAVTEAISSGGLKGNEVLRASMTLSLEEVNFTTTIDGNIALE